MSEFIIPVGKKTGCLRRSTRVGECCPLFGERIKVLSDADIRAAIAARQAAGVRGRDLVKVIFDQDGVGSCGTEGTAQGAQVTRVGQNLPFVQLNPWFLYFHSSGGVDRGSALDDNLELARDIGIASEAVWPRSKGWRQKPSDEAYADALLHRVDEFYDVTTLAEARTAMVEGFVLLFGHDYHAELMIDLLSFDEADVANSWSKQWGDGGFHKFPVAGINFAYGCFAFRSAN